MDCIESGVFEMFVKFFLNLLFFFSNATILCQLLQSFLVLMNYPNLLEWSNITKKFVEKISVYVNGRSKVENNDSLYLSLDIILNVLKQW